MDKGASPDGDRAAGATHSSPQADLTAGSIPCAGMLTCIVCDKSFDTAANDPNFACVPYAGTLFYSSGHYGSTVFDPFDGTRLEIVVCDDCLVRRNSRVALILRPIGPSQRLPWVEGAERAQAIEARRAETQGGSVHESAVPQGWAQ